MFSESGEAKNGPLRPNCSRPSPSPTGSKATDDKLVALRNQFMRATDEPTKNKLADLIHARAFEIGTHAPLGEFEAPMAARKAVTGFFVTNGNLYWNLKKS